MVEIHVLNKEELATKKIKIIRIEGRTIYFTVTDKKVS
jgi:hypothetical protein